MTQLRADQTLEIPTLTKAPNQSTTVAQQLARNNSTNKVFLDRNSNTSIKALQQINANKHHHKYIKAIQHNNSKHTNPRQQ